MKSELYASTRPVRATKADEQIGHVNPGGIDVIVKPGDYLVYDDPPVQINGVAVARAWPAKDFEERYVRVDEGFYTDELDEDRDDTPPAVDDDGLPVRPAEGFSVEALEALDRGTLKKLARREGVPTGPKVSMITALLDTNAAHREAGHIVREGEE